MTGESRFLGIERYAPRHVESVADLGPDRQRLRSLEGAELVRHHAVWDDEDDAWFTDGPVVLDFGSARLELAAFQVHMCLSWDSVDVAAAIEWFPGSTFRLSWRRDPFPALLDGPLSAVVALEHEGDLRGLGFESAGGYFAFFNALDELGLSRDRSGGAAMRRVRL